MESIHEKRQHIHKWLDQAQDIDIEELWEMTIMEDEETISEAWETELELRRKSFKEGNAKTLTLDELKDEVERLSRKGNV